MTSIDPVWATVAELSRAFGARTLSPVDAVEALLERIRRRDAALHAFIAVYEDDARLAAEAADKAIRSGHRVGPAPRRADRAQGPRRHRGPRHDRRLEGLGGARLAGHRDAGRAAHRRRHDRARQDAHGRVRDGQLGHQHAHGHAAEPVGPRRCTARPAARPAARASRSPPGLAPVAIGTDTGGSVRLPAGVVRHRRPQGDGGADQHVRRAAAQHDARHAGPDGALGRGRGADLPRAERPRPARSADARVDAGRSAAGAAARRRRPAAGGDAGRRAGGRRRRTCSPPTTPRSTRSRSSAPTSCAPTLPHRFSDYAAATGRIIGAEGYRFVGHLVDD